MLLTLKTSPFLKSAWNQSNSIINLKINCLKRKLWLVVGLYYVRQSYFGSSLSYDDLLSFRLFVFIWGIKKSNILIPSSVPKTVGGFNWILEDTETQKGHAVANGAKSRYGELMIERKSMDQNVEHICHPQKAVKMGGARENSWELMLMWNYKASLIQNQIFSNKASQRSTFMVRCENFEIMLPSGVTPLYTCTFLGIWDCQ